MSETQNLINAIKKDAKLDDAKKADLIRAATARLRHGFRDNTWFMQTKGTDYDLAPPAARRVAVVRTIYAEADGVALPDPDPANPKATGFAWMTLHKYTPDRDCPVPVQGLEQSQITSCLLLCPRSPLVPKLCLGTHGREAPLRVRSLNGTRNGVSPTPFPSRAWERECCSDP